MPLFDRPPVPNFPDRALREALEQVQNLRDVLFQVVPDVAANLDFGRVQYIKPAFLLEDWRGRESDLLCLIPYRAAGAAEGETVLICVLLEHQSRPDAHMPLRMLLYAVLFWEQQWKEYERRHEEGASLRLTPVVPIVFHTGAGEWTGNRRLADLFEGPAALKAYAPQWPVLFWDLGSRSPEALLASDGPFAQFLAIVRAEGSDAERFRQVYAQLAEQLEPLAQQDKMRWRDLLWLIFSWVLQRRPVEEGEALRQVLVDRQRDAALRQEVQIMSEGTKKTWIQLERERAQAAAEAEVEARTEVRARQELLILLLGDVGNLPESLAADIRACEDLDRLLAGLRQVRTLTSLDQFQF